MKKIIYILISTLFLTGCFNYRDVNRIIFVTAVCIDIDEDNNPVLYVEAFSSTRTTGAPSGEETKVLFKGTGKTIFEAIRNITNTAAVKLNYTQNKAIIFTEKAAEYGLDHFLDFLLRDQEFLVRQFVYITNIDIEKLLKIELKEETFIGMFLADLSENKPARTKKPSMRIDELYVARKLGSQINGISLIEEETSNIINRVDINKLAILKEDKLIDILKYDETFIYFVMINNLSMGYLRVNNPDAEGKFIDLEILKTKTKTKINYDGGDTIDVIKEVSMKTTIAEVQGHFDIFTIEKRDALQREAEKGIVDSAMELYEKYKEKDIDIYNLKRDIDIKYPNANLDEDNILNSINFIIKPDVFIEGSTDVLNFY